VPRAAVLLSRFGGDDSAAPDRRCNKTGIKARIAAGCENGDVGHVGEPSEAGEVEPVRPDCMAPTVIVTDQ
jgi:hypothetical protein